MGSNLTLRQKDRAATAMNAEGAEKPGNLRMLRLQQTVRRRGPSQLIVRKALCTALGFLSITIK